MYIKKRFELTSDSFGSNHEATPSQVTRFFSRNNITAFTAKGLDSLVGKMESLNIGESLEHHTYDGGKMKVVRLDNF